MIGVLHVLQYPHLRAPMLHSQRVEYTDPPCAGRPFRCTPLGSPGRPFATHPVDGTPRPASELGVWFRAGAATYLLEPLPAADPAELA